MVRDLAPDDHVLAEYYSKLCVEAPSWFRVSLRLEPEDFGAFFLWAKRRVTRIFDIGSVIIFATPGPHPHALDLHPCILPHRQPRDAFLSSLADLLSYIGELGYIRLAVPITNHRGTAMRRWLRELGFVKEGILRGYVLADNDLQGNSVLLDTEFWSILKE